MQSRAYGLALLCIIFALSLTKIDAIIYISPTGVDSNDCLTSGTACKSLTRAYAAAQATDTVSVLAGDNLFSTQQTLGGSSKTVTFVGAGRTTSILRGAVTNTAFISISASAANRITFSNLRIVSEGTSTSAVDMTNSQLTISESDIVATRGAAFRALSGTGTCVFNISKANIQTQTSMIVATASGSSVIEDSTVTASSAAPTALLTISPTSTTWGLSLVRTTFFNSNGSETGGVKFNPSISGGGGPLGGGGSVGLLVDSCTFRNITSSTYGALYVTNTADITVRNSRFLFNRAPVGSAIAMIKMESMNINGSYFEGNFADKGTVYRDGPASESLFGPAVPIVLTFSTFVNNVAGSGGGAFYLFYDASFTAGNVLVSGCNFTNNAALGSPDPAVIQAIGGAIYFAGYLPDGVVSDCIFYGNKAMSTARKDIFVGGGAIYWAGLYTNWQLTRNIFDSNLAYTPVQTTSGGALASAIIMLGFTFEVSQSTFRNNTAAGLYIRATRSSTGAGAISMVQVPYPAAYTPADSFLVFSSCNFFNNTAYVIPSINGTNNGQGGVMLIQLAEPTVAATLTATVSNSLFSGNLADVGACIVVSDVTLNVDNNVFRSNLGEEAAGAVAALQSRSIVRVRSSLFESNRVLPSDPLERSYSDILAQNTGAFEISNCTFRDIDWYPSIPFSSSIGVIGPGTRLVFSPASPQPQGIAVNIPVTFAGSGAIVDVQQVTPRFDGLTLWYRTGAGIPDARSEIVFNYNTTVVTQFVMNNGSINARGAGQFILRGTTEIITKGPNTIANALVRNYGTVKHYESETRISNSTIVNEAGATWNFINFTPEVNLTNSDTTRSSFFNNSGLVQLSTFRLSAVSFSQSSSGVLRFILSNFWRPSVLNVVRTSSRGTAQLGGTFELDSMSLSQYSEPIPFQAFLVLSTPTGFTSGSFSSLNHRGGYTYSVSVSSAGGSDNYYARVTGFYPRKAAYSNTGTTIVVTFPRPTNTPGFGSCGSLLQSVTLTSIDLSSSACLWRSSSELIISSSRLPPVGATLQFLPNVVLDAINPTFNMSTSLSVIIAGPDAPVAPTAVVIAPDQVASCDNLVMDGSASFGGGLLPMTYYWTLNSSDAADASLRSLVASTANATLVLLPSMFPAIVGSSKTYLFQLSVTSSFGRVSSVVSHVVTVYTDNRVRVIIEGLATRTHIATEPLKLQARIKFASCTPTASQSAVTLSWAQLSGPTPRRASLTGTSTPTLFFSAGSFDSGSTYTFELSANFAGITSTARVGVSVVGAPMTLISSGDGGFVPSNTPLSLRVTLLDPSLGVSSPTYTWLALRCPTRGQQNTNTGSGANDGTNTDPEIAYNAREIGPAVIFDGVALRDLLLSRPNGVVCPGVANTIQFAPLANSTSPDLVTVSAGSLLEGDYLIAVVANKDVRVAQALISFTVVSPSAGYTRSIPVSLTPRFISGSKVLPAQRLAIAGSANGNADLPPAGYDAVFVERELGNATITTIVRSRTSNGTLNSVVEAGTLSPGIFYFLELQVIDRTTGAVAGSNRIVLAVNSAPTGGSLSVDPATGGLQYQEIRISAPGWNDDSDAPLRYVFSVSRNLSESDSSTELVLSDGLEVPNLVTILPIGGPPSQGNRIRVTVRVYDSLGAESSASIQIESISSSLSVALGYSRLQQQLLQGDLSESVPLMLALLDALNSDPTQDTQNIRVQIADLLSQYCTVQALSEANLRILFMGIRLLVAVPSAMTEAIRDDVVFILQNTLSQTNITDSTLRALIAVESASSQRAVSSLLLAIKDFIIICSPASNNTGVKLTLPQALFLYDVVRRLSVLQSQTALLGENGAIVSVASLTVNSVLLSSVQLPQGVSFSLGPDGSLVSIVQTTGADGRPSTVSTVIWQNGTFPVITTDSTNTTIGSGAVTITIGGSSSGQQYTISANMTGTLAIAPDGSTNAPVGCGVYDPVLSMWSSTGCTLSVINSASGPIFQCTCPNLITTSSSSSGTGSGATGGDTRSLTLLFTIPDGTGGGYAPSPPTPVSGGGGVLSPSGTPTSSNTGGGTAQGTPDVSNNLVAIIAGAVVAFVVIAAIVIGLVVYRKVFVRRRRHGALQMQRIRSGAQRNTTDSITTPRETAQ